MVQIFEIDTVNRCAPVSTVQWIVFGGSVAAAILAFHHIQRIYRVPGATWVGVLAAYIVGLCISFIPVQLIAYLCEDRKIWLPHNHSAIFFWGDSIGLPTVAAGFAYLRRQCRDERPLADRLYWRWIVIVIAVSISTLYHLNQAVDWKTAKLLAPSKFYHDFFVYPIFLYYLGSQIPFFYRAIADRFWRWQTSSVRTAFAITAVCGGFLFWGWAGTLYAAQSPVTRPLFGFA